LNLYIFSRYFTMEQAIRFLLFPKGEQILKSFVPTTSFGEIKSKLLEEWPKDFDPITSIDDMKFIHSGRVIENTQVIQDTLKPSNTADPVTVHLVLHRPSQSSTTPTPPSSTVEESPISAPSTPSTNDSAAPEIHFHGSMFSETDAERLRALFDTKKGDDNKIAFLDLYKFIRMYWNWTASNNLRDSNQQFPMTKLMNLKRSIIGTSDRVSCEQFVQIYFLFDAQSNGQNCPDGSMSRVKMAVERLHQNMQPNTTFPEETFNQLFTSVDTNADGQLDCDQIDLLFYLYSLQVTDPSLFA